MIFKIFVTIFCFALRATALNNRSFPDGFKFGVATAAYQVEGGWNEDGKSASIWDTLVHTQPSPILNNATGDIACDSYHKYEEDIQLLKDLGVNFYRFSLSWTRLLPLGTTNYVNQKGVDYYMKIFKLLNESGIEPLVTMYHWDLPQNLQDLGGWTNPKMADYFSDYAEFLYKTFGKYVKKWATINECETICFASYGAFEGFLAAPAYNLTAEGIYQCSYTLLKAHAKAYHIYQDKFKASQNGQVSIVLVSSWAQPATTSQEDIYEQELYHQFFMGLYAHPIYRGDWPLIVKERVETRSKLEGYEHSRLPELTKEDIDLINGTADFFALNYYSNYIVSYSYNETDVQENGSFLLDNGAGANSQSDPSWVCSKIQPMFCKTPDGLRNMLNWIQNNYNPSEIIITENGWSGEGHLNDTDRIDYIQIYLSSLLDAIYVDKINVVGYTHWSLLDNFEWMSGYAAKFGLVHVDFDSENRTRTPKASYQYYKQVIKSKCLNNECNSSSGEIKMFCASLILLGLAILKLF